MLERATEQEALDERDAGVDHDGEIFLALDALGDDLHADVAAEIQSRVPLP